MDEVDAQCDKLSVHAGRHHQLGVGGGGTAWHVDAQCDKLSVHAGHHHQLGVGGWNDVAGGWTRWTLSVINYLYTQVITTTSG